MVKKVLAIAFLIAIIGGPIIAMREYRQYRVRQQERIARLQEKAEEVQVTTIEGWTAADIATELENKKLFDAKAFAAAQASFDLEAYPIIEQSKPKKNNMEGFLFPDTYRYNTTSTPEIVLNKMLANFSDRVETLGISAEKEKYAIPGFSQYPLTFYQILTLASIIEKESGGKGSMSLDQERALIAGVFYNRLAAGQALQSDATVNYITGKDSPGVSSQDLTVNSPYNTYKYPGLPPGPICNPSLSSIKAALNPETSDYFYFLHKQPSGEVVFSKTFAEHERRRGEK